MFGLPPKLREYVALLKWWAITVRPFPDPISLPSDLATVDDMEDAAIETYALLTHGRG